MFVGLRSVNGPSIQETEGAYDRGTDEDRCSSQRNKVLECDDGVTQRNRMPTALMTDISSPLQPVSVDQEDESLSMSTNPNPLPKHDATTPSILADNIPPTPPEASNARVQDVKVFYPGRRQLRPSGG